MSKSKTTRKLPATARAMKTPATARKPAKQAKPSRIMAQKATQANAPAKARAGTKQALLIAELRRKEGATIVDLVEATRWQAHSVRGAISGTLKNKLGLTVSSEKVAGRGRVYRIMDGR